MRNALFLLLFLPMPFVSYFRPWIGMLIWGWLALLNPHRDLYGFASTLPYNELIAIPTLAGWILSGEFRKFRLDLTSGLLILLWSLMTVSTIFSLAPEQSWPKYGEFSKIILYAIVLQSFLTTRTRFHTLMWLLVLGLGFYGVKGGTLFVLTGGSHQFAGPPGTMINDRNYLALAILMTIPLMNYLRLQSAHTWIKLGLLATMLLSVLAVIGTFSRGGFIGMVALGSIIWLRARHKLQGLILFGILAVLVAQAAPSAWRVRMSSIQTAEQNDGSFKGRLVAWQTYLAAAMDHPLTGAGLYALNSPQVYFNYQPYETGIDYNNTKARAAHSIYFQVLGELGIVSFLIYMVLSTVALSYSLMLSKAVNHASASIWIGDISKMIFCSLFVFFIVGAALSAAFYDLYLILVIATSSLRLLLRYSVRVVAPPTFHALA